MYLWTVLTLQIKIHIQNRLDASQQQGIGDAMIAELALVAQVGECG